MHRADAYRPQNLTLVHAAVGWSRVVQTDTRHHTAEVGVKILLRHVTPTKMFTHLRVSPVQHYTYHAAVLNQALRRLDALQRVLELGGYRLIAPWQPAQIIPGAARDADRHDTSGKARG